MPDLLYANPVVSRNRPAEPGAPNRIFCAALARPTRQRHGYQGSPWGFKQEKRPNTFFSAGRDGAGVTEAARKLVSARHFASSLVSCWLVGRIAEIPQSALKPLG